MKKKIFWAVSAILALLLAVNIIILICMSNPTARAKHQLELAQRYLEEMEYEEAIAAFEKAIAIDPKLEEAYIGLADVYIALEDYESALTILEQGYEEIEERSLSRKIAKVQEMMPQEKEVETEVTAIETEAQKVQETEVIAEEETAEESTTEVEQENNNNAHELPEYYQVYAKLLLQFMCDPHAYYSANLAGSSFMEGMKFAVKDINHDNREELIIWSDEYSTYNLIVPSDNWKDANVGPFDYYDEESGQMAWFEGDIGGYITYYELNGDTLDRIDEYSYDETDVYVNTSEGWYESKYNDGRYFRYYHNRTIITEDEFDNQPAFKWDELSADWYEINLKNINSVLLGKENSDSSDTDSTLNKQSINIRKQGSNLEIISLDAGNKGPIITYKINDKVKTVEFDYSAESSMFEFFFDYDYQLGDLTGDGIDELVISMYISNNLSDYLQDTFVYTLNGEDLIELIHVDPDDWFVSDCAICGVSIVEGQLNIMGGYKILVENYSFVMFEHRSLKYADGKWTEIYRDKFHISEADGPYDGCIFANESELYVEFCDKYIKEPEKMLSIYPEMYESVIK